MCHGIPNDRPLADGDIVNIDITVFLDGYHGDTSRTIMIGSVDQLGVDLVNITNLAMQEAISLCGPNVPFSEIGRVINQLAIKNGYSVNPHFCGHGIGKYFHQPPYVLHYFNNDHILMERNFTFTIEPILCQGILLFSWVR
jgi:methionyl aminopeptidase